MGTGRHLAGKILQGTYRIERLLGEGGMGAVYEVSHLRLARRFAVKLLDEGVTEHPDALARFQREALVTSALGHPHIVEVIDFNQTDDDETPYIVMELLEGEDLAARLRRTGRLGLDQVASIFRQASSALHAAHEGGVIHRDLKSQNIFLCRRGERDDFVKVVDFGISKVLGGESAMTRTHSLLGTPAYMSPEQAEERAAAVDLRTDIYAMGVILFEALAGQPPFLASSVPTLLYKIVHEKPPPLSSLRPNVPRAVEQTIARAMAKRPQERFESMKAFWLQFAVAVQQHDVDFAEPTEDRQMIWTADIVTSPDVHGASRTIPSPPPVGAGQLTTLSESAGETTLRPPPSSRRKRRWLPLALVGVAAILLPAVIVGLLVSRDQRRPPPERRVNAAGAGTNGTNDTNGSPPADAAGVTLPADAAIATGGNRRDAAARRARALWLDSRPSATVFVGRRRLGRTPLRGVRIGTGAATLILRRRGHTTTKIALDAGTDDLRLPLARLRRRPPRAQPAERRGRGRKQQATDKDWIIRPKIE